MQCQKADQSSWNDEEVCYIVITRWSFAGLSIIYKDRNFS
jgi:hypothetical protein